MTAEHWFTYLCLMLLSFRGGYPVDVLFWTIFGDVQIFIFAYVKAGILSRGPGLPQVTIR